MKAALIRELGAAPEVAVVDDPGEDAIDVLAAPVNPIDLAVSRGILAAGHPELPYVPGCEAVGRSADGKLVWIFGGGLGLARNGAMAERASIGSSFAIEVPDGADPALAAALGIDPVDLRIRNAMAPGSMRGLQLVVSDAAAARAELVERGVTCDEVQVFDERDGGTFFGFADPDGNTWAVQELRVRAERPLIPEEYRGRFGAAPEEE